MSTENVIRKIEALLNVQGCTEQEAQARIEKAQDLLEKYNLDMSSIGKTKKGAFGAPRKDEKRKGGLYKWQRDLWQAVANLNFCHYISIKGLSRGSTYEHRIIGSHVNIVATEVMAQYLQDTVERLAQTWAKANGYKSVFVRDAIAYREGMTSRLSERLQAKRREREKEEKREHDQPSYTGNALTIVDIASNEDDLNKDFLYGLEPGTTSRRRAEREARYAAQVAEREQWEKDNPEEAARQEAERQAESDRWYEEYLKREARNAKRRKGTGYQQRAKTAEEQRAELYSFQEGRHKAEDIGLDQQVDKEQRRKVT